MEDKEKEISKDHAVFTMGFNKDELEIVDLALRDAIAESLTNIAHRMRSMGAEVLQENLQSDVMMRMELLVRVNKILGLAYDSAHIEHDKED